MRSFMDIRNRLNQTSLWAYKLGYTGFNKAWQNEDITDGSTAF